MEFHNNHSAFSVGAKLQSSSLKWLGICLGLIALAVVAVSVFHISVSTLFMGAVLLACPLMHILMMKRREHKHQETLTQANSSLMVQGLL